MEKRESIFGRTQRPAPKAPDLIHLGLCLLITGGFIFLLSSGRMERAEKIFLDYFLRQRPAQPVSSDLLLVDIDEESLRAIGPWPWPWRYHAEIVRILKNAGAKAIVFDYPFEGTPLEEDHALLSKVVAEAGNVYLPVSLETRSNKKIWIHSMPVDLEPAGEKTVWEHAPMDIEARAADIGHINLTADEDGVLRRVRAFLSFEGETYPYEALAAAYQVRKPGVKWTSTVQDWKPPMDEQGRIMINWLGRDRERIPKISFAAAVRSAQAAQTGIATSSGLEKVRGKVCLIGVTAPGLSKTAATPLEAACPSVLVQAQVLSSALTGHYLIPASFIQNAFYLSLAGFLASLCFVLFRGVAAFFFGLGLGAGFLVLSFLVFWRNSIWIYPAHPLLLTLTLFIFSAIYTAITGARERSKLFDLATRDGLTGLFVIRHFREILNQEVQQAQAEKRPLSVILIDIDNFKKINDTYGHPAGDMVLKKIAETVCANCRIKRPMNKIDFVARYGGEELILMLRSKLSDAAFKVAERIRKAVEQTVFEWDGQQIKVTISLGAACLHTGENVPDLMVRRADEALYRAKHNGKNQVCVETFAT